MTATETSDDPLLAVPRWGRTRFAHNVIHSHTGPTGDMGERGVDGLIDEYLVERQARGEINGKTVKVGRSRLGTFETWRRTNDIPLRQITQRHLEQFLAANPEWRQETRRGLIGALRPFFRWLVAMEYIDRDPTTLLKVPRSKKPLPRNVAADAVTRLLEACRSVYPETEARDKLITILMIQCGLRCIEVSRIDIEDIDTRARTVDIRGKNGDGDVTRVVSIPAEAWRFIAEYLIIRPAFSGPLVRATYRDTRFGEGSISIRMTKIFTDAGLKKGAYDGMSAHALRHTFAQDLVDSGVDIRLVQSALGHSTVSTTEIYVRRKPPGLAAAMEGRTYAV